MSRTPQQYKDHYANYQGKPEQIAKRSMHNKARREVVEKKGKAAVAGLDVDHKKRIAHGGGNGKGNLRLQSPAVNRGWRRDSKK